MCSRFLLSLCVLCTAFTRVKTTQSRAYEAQVGMQYACATSPLPQNDECSKLAGWTQEDGNAHRTARAADVSRFLPSGSVLEKVWRSTAAFDFPAKLGNDGTVYISDNALYALWPQNGTVKWVLQDPGRKVKNAYVVAPDNQIYIATSRATAGGEVCDFIVAWGHNATVRKIEPCSDRVFDQDPLLSPSGLLYLPSYKPDTAVATYNTSNQTFVCNMEGTVWGGRSVVLAGNGALVFTDGNSALRAHNALTCGHLWTASVDLQNTVPIADDFGNILLLVEGHTVANYNASNGTEIWKTQLNSFCAGGRIALASNLTMVVRCNAQYVYGVSQITGQILWDTVLNGTVTRVGESNHISVSSNNTAYGTVAGGWLYGIDAANGSIVQHIPIEPALQASRVIIGGDGSLFLTATFDEGGEVTRIFAYKFRYDCRYGAHYQNGCFAGLAKRGGSLARIWQSPRNGIDCTGSPSVLRSGGIVESCSRYLLAFASNGTEKGSYDLSQDHVSCTDCHANQQSAVVSEENRVYLADQVASASLVQMRVWNASTLAREYISSRTGCAVRGLPLVVNERVYVASTNEAVYVYFISNGSLSSDVLFRADPSRAESSCGDGFQRGVSGGYGDILYIPHMNGTLYSLFLNGTLRWGLFLGAHTTSSVAVDPASNVAYLTANATQLVAVDVQGSILWQSTVGAAGIYPPLLIPRTLYLGTKDGVLHAMHTSNGSAMWTTSIGGELHATPRLTNNQQLFIASSNGPLYMVDAQNGSLLAGTNIGVQLAQASTFSFSTPTVNADGILFAVHFGLGFNTFAGFSFCPPGYHASELECIRCPAGTYRTSEHLCTECNSTSQFCPIGTMQPLPIPRLVPPAESLASRYDSPQKFEFVTRPLVSDLNDCGTVYSYAVVAALFVCICMLLLCKQGFDQAYARWKYDMFRMAARMDRVHYPETISGREMERARLIVHRWTTVGFLATALLLLGGIAFVIGVAMYSSLCNERTSTVYIPQQVPQSSSASLPSFSVTVRYEIAYARRPVDPCSLAHFSFSQDVFTRQSSVTFSVARLPNLNNATGLCRVEISCPFPCEVDPFSPQSCIQVDMPFIRTYAGKLSSGVAFLRTSYSVGSSLGEEKGSGDILEYGPDIGSSLFNQQVMQVQEQVVDNQVDSSKSFTSVRMDLQVRGATAVNRACFGNVASALLLRFSSTQREQTIIENFFSLYTLFAIAVSTLSTAYAVLRFLVKKINGREQQYEIQLPEVLSPRPMSMQMAESSRDSNDVMA